MRRPTSFRAVSPLRALTRGVNFRMNAAAEWAAPFFTEVKSTNTNKGKCTFLLKTELTLTKLLMDEAKQFAMLIWFKIKKKKHI